MEAEAVVVTAAAAVEPVWQLVLSLLVNQIRDIVGSLVGRLVD